LLEQAEVKSIEKEVITDNNNSEKQETQGT
jgi:hypothetical protein